MRKFFGPMGHVTRLTIESQVLRTICWAIRRRAPSTYMCRPVTMDKDYRCSSIWSASPAAASLTPTGRLPREHAGAPRSPDRRRTHATRRHCLPRLLHPPRRQSVHQLRIHGAWEDFLLHEMLPLVEQHFGCGGTGRRGVFGKSSGGYGAITHALRHADIWAVAACHSGDMGFELCYLPDMPAVLRALAGTENSIERWWSQLEAAQKHSDGSGKVINALAMAASYDPDPSQFLGMRLPVTFDTCEVIADRWANWLRQDPAVAVDNWQTISEA